MKLRHSFLVFATLASITTLISAQTATWSLTSGDSWNTTANWSTDPTIPDSTTSIADFTQDFIDTPVITLDNASGFTVNGINFDDTGVTADSSLTINSGTGGKIILAGTTPTISVSALDPLSASLTVNTVLEGTAGLTKVGDGTLKLAAANTYTGGTWISTGTIQWGIAGALGTGTITLGDASSGTSSISLLGTTAATTLSNNITVSSLGSGTVTIGGGQTTGAVFYSGLITLNRAVTLVSPSGVDRTDFTGNITGNVGTLAL